MSDERISLPCPYCRHDIEQALSWFRQPWFTCPACNGNLSDRQFAPLVAALEDAMEASTAEMIHGNRSGCGCPGGGCGGHGHGH